VAKIIISRRLSIYRFGDIKYTYLESYPTKVEALNEEKRLIKENVKNKKCKNVYGRRKEKTSSSL